MPTVKEILEVAIDLDMKWWAHTVFWAVKEGKVQATEDADSLNEIDYDDVAIEAMIVRNVLEVGKVQLYVAETTTPSLFAFYYAENVLAVTMLHQALFRETPKRIVNGDELMWTVFEFEDQRASEILFMHRSKVAAFPYYIGHAWAGEHVFFKRHY